jgi:hypothetical protein
MEFDAESLQRQIPFYLTAEDQQVLVRELKSIASGASHSANYLLSDFNDSFSEVMLQGDGWRGFQLFIFESGERRSVRGIVLSNSCDVSPENPRDVPARVVFAPLVKLSTFEALLLQSGADPAKVQTKIASIKTQKTTNVFFLPASGALTDDYIVRFDDAHSMPVAAHIGGVEREKLFTLSDTGFYMLVLKLSFHFCRLHERVNRKNSAGPV